MNEVKLTLVSGKVGEDLFSQRERVLGEVFFEGPSELERERGNDTEGEVSLDPKDWILTSLILNRTGTLIAIEVVGEHRAPKH